MTNLLPKKEYMASLPKKRMGAAVIFLNESGELLILKPNYKDGWMVPGGTVDAEESPLQAAIREVKEEIGLDIPDLKFLLVEHVSAKGDSTEGIEFAFDGGVLDSNQVSAIAMQQEEFDEMQFLKIEEALPLIRASTRRSVAAGLKIMKTKIPEYNDVNR